LVEVALVPVALKKVKLLRVDEAKERKPPVRVERPETERLERVPREVREEARTFEARVAPVRVPAGAVPVMLPVRLPVRLPTPEVKKRFVVEALVAKKLVVVAEVPVAFRKVKFWRVDEPVRRRFERVVSPAVAVRVPVKLAAEEMVWELMSPEVKAPETVKTWAVPLPRVIELVRMSEVEALVAKKLVEVALVPVALKKVKLLRVDEAREYNPPVKPVRVEVELLAPWNG